MVSSILNNAVELGHIKTNYATKKFSDQKDAKRRKRDIYDEDVKAVSLSVGRADIKTTLNIYAQYTRKADIEVSDKINELLS